MIHDSTHPYFQISRQGGKYAYIFFTSIPHLTAADAEKYGLRLRPYLSSTGGCIPPHILLASPSSNPRLLLRLQVLLPAHRLSVLHSSHCLNVRVPSPHSSSTSSPPPSPSPRTRQQTCIHSALSCPRIRPMRGPMAQVQSGVSPVQISPRRRSLLPWLGIPLGRLY